MNTRDPQQPARGAARNGYAEEMGELITVMIQPEPPALEDVPPRVRELADRICRRPHARKAIEALATLKKEAFQHDGE